MLESCFDKAITNYYKLINFQYISGIDLGLNKKEMKRAILMISDLPFLNARVIFSLPVMIV